MFKFKVFSGMRIGDLPLKTTEELCNALEIAPTMDWKMLMRTKPFRHIYSIAMINLMEGIGGNPAKALLKDFYCREIKIQDLVNGLEEIGNIKAVSIIERGANKKFDIRDLGGRSRRPPIIRQPEEHTMDRMEQTETLRYPVQESEQTETLRYPVEESEQTETLRYPVQESDTNAGCPCDDPRLRPIMVAVNGLFPCLRLYSF